MFDFELSPEAQHWVNVVLIWIGFGTLVGLLAVVILPVRRPSGPIATLLLGILGSVLGLSALSWFFPGREINPISPLGFISATGGAFLLLVLIRGGQACFDKKQRDEEREEE